MVKTFIEKLGLNVVKKLNVKICKERVKHLENIIEKNQLPPRLMKQAKYYRSWYKWIANNGGKRPVKKVVKKAVKKKSAQV